ncbi:hypothetical protein CGGC5_v009498 [Colletotrichum fructicola Nara gc5]|uniref:Uncharacterized protein n=1 Tax=Colletotrichum fructicola (strain Nara gc5) TaxID=1213859 RepID=A0A7J6J392_COLFN|nr:hypothetical protein CGGC5_v009498 [Colletotrichum fructicola Nara gc5]
MGVMSLAACHVSKLSSNQQGNAARRLSSRAFVPVWSACILLRIWSPSVSPWPGQIRPQGPKAPYAMETRVGIRLRAFPKVTR